MEFQLDRPEVIKAILFLTKRGSYIKSSYYVRDYQSPEWAIHIIIKQIEVSMGLNSSSEEEDPGKVLKTGQSEASKMDNSSKLGQAYQKSQMMSKEEVQQQQEEGNKARNLFRRYLNLLVRAVWNEQRALNDLAEIIFQSQKSKLYNKKGSIWLEEEGRKDEILRKKLNEMIEAQVKTQKSITKSDKEKIK